MSDEQEQSGAAVSAGEELTHNPETGVKYLKLTEISQHTKPESLWIIIDNFVYDVTKFAYEHPGGEEILYEQGGKDASVPFDDVGHSRDAREMMVKFQIGEVHPDDKTTKKSKAASSSAGQGSDGDHSRGWFSNIMYGLGFGLLSVAAYKLFV